MNNSKNNFHEMLQDIKACKTVKELIKVATYIDQNKKKLNLDLSDIEQLESIGMRQHDEILRSLVLLAKNGK